MYSLLYTPYYNKLLAIQNELKIREEEIALIVGKYDSYGELSVVGLQNAIMSENEKIQSALNFHDFLGEELWLDFAAYRRDDT